MCDGVGVATWPPPPPVEPPAHAEEELAGLLMLVPAIWLSALGMPVPGGCCGGGGGCSTGWNSGMRAMTPSVCPW
ncbi:hypothetical protein ACFQ0O_04085 [Saccharopolyspora spinosporotrichia]